MTNGGTRFQYNKDEESCLTKEQIEFKRSVRERIIEARGEGVSAGEIANHIRGNSIHTVYDMLEARQFPMSAWYEMDKALKEIGY